MIKNAENLLISDIIAMKLFDKFFQNNRKKTEIIVKKIPKIGDPSANVLIKSSIIAFAMKK